MGFKDSGWRPKGVTDFHNGFEVFDYDHGPHEINDGEVDGEIDFSGLDESE